ncbi:hypothetical protein BCR36DRAFT_364443 [Piromyces finnis]|uniref:Coth-domain-containing protein n=1 Tax=Piromyces finnis TaxID=1754191 RepID=A0A1Y1UUW8_9FUNG|nr:hypothetical protein BCR36DRAFT_364443 [Piromyces finnis]|eukprot:ORX41374.1 hypothetical protein BCR36DRAFT_364443 [Piromyces finnis]
MNIKCKIFILSLISKIYAAKFSVISFNGNCQVNVGGQLYDMVQEIPDIPLYTALVDAPLQTTYNYICGGVNDIERVLMEENTHNELVGRATTLYDMPEFEYFNESWNRSIGRTELFDPDYIPTVIVNTDEYYFVQPSTSGKFERITFILKDNVFTFNNVHFSSKNFDQDKFQFEVLDLPNGGIYGRDDLKFRPSSYDPVFFRQILYGDIAHAIGNPAHESVAVRVYSGEGTPIGLYVLQENTASESFIKSAFYGNPQTEQISEFQSGTDIYDCSTGADFTNIDLDQLGAFQNINNSDDYKIDLQELNDKLNALDVNDEAAINDFNKNFFDLETLLKALALEYLAAHWDSYWFLTSNFVVFHPPEETEGTEYNHTKMKYYFIDQDFDQTWGSNIREELDPYNYPMKPYTEYVGKDNAYWKSINTDEEYDWGSRVLLNKFLGCDGHPNCITKNYFENYLKSIVQTIFNPTAMEKKVNGYKARLADEIKWDCGLERLHTGTCAEDGCVLFKFTYDDFERGIVGPTGPFIYGILDWTRAMAESVSSNLNFSIDNNQSNTLTGYDNPDTTNLNNISDINSSNNDASNILGSNINLEDYSGSIMTVINIKMLTLFAILSFILIV